ncbi:MAG TPA: transporter [Calditrichaeota bacterium]|nr:transporter [Calditrichota bacterium]
MFKTKVWIFIFCLSISSAYSAGFSIYEQGAKASGMASAFIAQGNDLSSLFYNPAGITSLDGFQIGIGTTIIHTVFDFTGPEVIDSRMFTQAEQGVFPPSTFYATYKITSDLSVGFGFYSMFGLASEWGSEQEPWVGHYLTTKSALQTFSFNPVIAYKILDSLSIAVGGIAMQSNVLLEKDIYFYPRNLEGHSKLDASTMGYGFNAAMQYEPVQGLLLGAVYRSNVQLDFNDGTATFTFPQTGDPIVDGEVAAFFPTPVKATSQLTMPDFIGAGIAYRFTPNLTVEADYTRFGWSSYDKLVVDFAEPVGGQTQSVAERNYHDASSVRVGLEYYALQNLALRTGYAWEESAVPDAFVEPSLPEGTRHIYSFGAGYITGGFKIDISYQVLLQDDRIVENSVLNFNGKYRGLANMYSLSLGYAF